MGGFLNFTIELDPLALAALAAGVALGAVIFSFFTRWRMEDGLRSRRSPNQVRMEAAAVGVVIGAAFPCLATAWGFGWFLSFLVIAAIIAVWAKSSWLGWAAMLMGVVIAVGAVMFNLTPTASGKGAAAISATPPVQATSPMAAPDSTAPQQK